ncbi:MAG: alpha/beta hydrolase [Chloroflexi bacterium]|nr:MAG: alpha/beta hydrolase [Chloroflexota bacterium]
MTSLRGTFWRELFRYQIAHSPQSSSITDMRQSLDRLGQRVQPPKSVRVERTWVEGLQAAWFIPARAADDAVLLYLHGGGYSVGSLASHRGLVGNLAAACGLRTLMPEYRLAPENPFPAALEDALSVYRRLLADGIAPQRLVLGGESAGGGLTLATLLALRDRGLPLPAAAFALSPWTDLAATGDSLRTRARQDPWFKPEGVPIAAAYYVGNAAPTNPLISPLYGDLAGLPSLLIHVGDYEILLDDSTRLAAKARAAGVDVTLRVWEGMWHVFQTLAARVPEARRSVDEVGAWVQSRLVTAERREEGRKG